MSNRFLMAMAACVGVIFVSSAALALPVTTDDCLAKGKCAYVSPKGRVTCGLCPGQARAVEVPAGDTALCTDDAWSMSKTRRGICSGHGSVKVLVK
jgi:Protein of unknown function (DUF3761)